MPPTPRQGTARNFGLPCLKHADGADGGGHGGGD